MRNKIDHMCKICNQEHFHLMKHVKKVHQLNDKEYFDRFLKQDDHKCEFCHKETKFNSKYFSYDRFCSRQCVIKNTLKKNPEYASIGGKNGMKSRIRQDPFCQSKSGKLSNAVQHRKFTNKFRKEHEDLTPTEWLMWNHPEFRKLNPQKQDRRFLKYRIGGRGVESGYILDFSLSKYNLCIEIDHPHTHNKEYDAARDYFLKENGWVTLRFSNQEVNQNIDSVVKKIYSYIKGEYYESPKP